MVKIWLKKTKKRLRYEQLKFKMSPYTFCKKCTGSWRYDPVPKLQKMYGEIFTFNSSYLSGVSLNRSQIFTIINLFESTLWHCGQNLKKSQKRFLWRHHFGTLFPSKHQCTTDNSVLWGISFLNQILNPAVILLWLCQLYTMARG